ncbi:MAG TPA: Rieske 2Fe-2S domain-containing protein [Thermoanaerobaculia bacterium]|jgi:Rieske Fe-S protein
MSTRHDDLPKGEGKLLADRRIVLYRDGGGILSAMSSVCPHRGCDVLWNGDEKVWDCPCHGSRFAPDGAVLRGPATQPLQPAEVPA